MGSYYFPSLASPGPIGGTTPGSGRFTTLDFYNRVIGYTDNYSTDGGYAPNALYVNTVAGQQTNYAAGWDNVLTISNWNRYRYGAIVFVQAPGDGNQVTGALGIGNKLAPIYADINYFEIVNGRGWYTAAGGYVLSGEKGDSTGFEVLNGTSATYDATKVTTQILRNGTINTVGPIQSIGGAPLNVVVDNYAFIKFNYAAYPAHLYGTFGGNLSEDKGHVFMVRGQTGNDKGNYRLHVGFDGVAISAPTSAPSTTTWNSNVAPYTDESGSASAPVLKMKVVSSNGTVLLKDVDISAAYGRTTDPHVAGRLYNNLGIATFSAG